jgi:AraC-like DNA-binding protein
MQVRAEGLPDMAGQAAAEPPAPPDSLDLIEQRFARLMASGAYREESLSLYACAQRVGCPPQYLSYVLNHRIGERFSDHVAGYRIREILASLDRGEQRRKTILALAFEAGFQSKSAFYDAFRRTTGTTPRMYLAHHAS